MTESTGGGRRAGTMRVVRSRGALSGILLVALGVWGAAIPFFGPFFNYAYTPATTLTWTPGRVWLEILPGAATIIGGLLLLTTANRAVAVFGGYLASVAGAWFVVGPILGRLWAGPQGATGVPIGGTLQQVVEQIGFFYGLGAVILFLAAQAVGRFTVMSVRDVRAAERRREQQERQDETPPPPPETIVREVPVTETQVIQTSPATPAAPEPTRSETTFTDNRAVQPEEVAGRSEVERGSEDTGATRINPGARPPR